MKCYRRSTVDIKASPSVHCVSPLLFGDKEAIRGTCPQLSRMYQGYAGLETAPNFHPSSRISMGEACFGSLQDRWQHVSACRGLLFKVQTLSTTTSAGVIRALKAIFTCHGIPATLISDNSPQYSWQQFQHFAKEYHFQHITSSPYYPQRNGLAERMIKTSKSLLSKYPDPFLTLLAYRSTPLPWCGYSPAELLMGRMIRSEIPQHPITSYQSGHICLLLSEGKGNDRLRLRLSLSCSSANTTVI